jgi:hypothetical protein
MTQKQFQQVGELDELETFVGSKKAARPRAAERRKGMLAKTTKSGYRQRLTTLKKEF